MAIVSAIAAVSRNGVIGLDNKMPWHIPGDLKYFKRMTLGKPIIMGRKSYDSLGKPLPGRLNIVITRHPDTVKEQATPLFTEMENTAAIPDKNHRTGLLIVSSIEDALKAAKDTGAEEIMIGGGAQIYAAALPWTNRLYITRIEQDYKGDTFFPDIAQNEWKAVAEERHEGDPAYSFTVLERVVA